MIKLVRSVSQLLVRRFSVPQFQVSAEDRGSVPRQASNPQVVSISVVRNTAPFFENEFTYNTQVEQLAPGGTVVFTPIGRDTDSDVRSCSQSIYISACVYRVGGYTSVVFFLACLWDCDFIAQTHYSLTLLSKFCSLHPKFN